MSNSTLNSVSGEYSFAAVPMLDSKESSESLAAVVTQDKPGRDEQSDKLSIGLEVHQPDTSNQLDIPDVLALRAELEATDNHPSRIKGVMESIKDFASLGSLLRLTGTVSMVLALGFFLLDGFQSAAEHQERFWILLGFSSITAISGILISRLFKDQKGARSLVSVALISVPACFAVLGALVYSIFPLDGLSAEYPKYLLWQAGDVSQLTIAAVVCLIVSVVVGFLGFSVIAKQIRIPLFVSLLAGSLLLVVPVRESLWAVAVAAAILLVCVWIFFRHIKPLQTIKTHWSSFAIALTVLPFAIAATRGIWLYEVPAGFAMIGMAVGHFSLVFLARGLDGLPRKVSEAVSIFSGLAFVFFCINFQLDNRMAWLTGDFGQYEGLLAALLVSGLFLHLDVFINNLYIARACRILYSFLWLLLLATGTWMFGELHVIAVIMTIAVFTYGILKGYKSLSIVGAIAIVFIVTQFGSDLLNFVHGTGILGVVGFGIFCVIAAHILEKHGPVLKARYAQKKVA